MPLSYAAAKGHEGIVKLLLATGQVDANSKSTNVFGDGHTPLSYAAANGHNAVVRLLLARDQVGTSSILFDSDPCSFVPQTDVVFPSSRDYYWDKFFGGRRW
jgi:ankyrin repeat protein